MKYLLEDMTPLSDSQTEVERMAMKLDGYVINGSQQLFNVGFGLLEAARKEHTAAELVVRFSIPGRLTVKDVDETLVEMKLHAVRGELSELQGDGLPHGFARRLDPACGDSLTERTLEELRGGKGELLLNEVEHIMTYIHSTSERLDDDGRWDTGVMLESLGDVRRTLMALLGVSESGHTADEG